jgi:hypothetical protein
LPLVRPMPHGGSGSGSTTGFPPRSILRSSQIAASCTAPIPHCTQSCASAHARQATRCLSWTGSALCGGCDGR